MAFAVPSQQFGARVFPRRVDQRPVSQQGKDRTWRGTAEENVREAPMVISEDAPSSSFFTKQNSSRAKRSMFSFSSTPSYMEGQVFSSDFDGSMTKRARMNKAIVANGRSWCCPDKFVLDRSWMVGEGGESREVVLQKEREARVCQANYASPSSIPFSPIEPEESFKDVDESLLPCIPLVSMDDDENGKEESSRGLSISGALGATCAKNSSKLEHHKIFSVFEHPDANSIKKSVLHGSACMDAQKHLQGLLCLSNADLTIAAAAAATYAAVKPLEGSSNIDQDLLLEILSSPVFSKSLICSNKNIKKGMQESPIASSNKMLAIENHVLNGISRTSTNRPSRFWG